MTKQEKIRVEIDRIIRHWTDRSISADWAPLYGGGDASQDIVLYLEGEGVVILEHRVQRFNTQTGQPIQPEPYEVLVSLIEEKK